MTDDKTWLQGKKALISYALSIILPILSLVAPQIGLPASWIAFLAPQNVALISGILAIIGLGFHKWGQNRTENKLTILLQTLSQINEVLPGGDSSSAAPGATSINIPTCKSCSPDGPTPTESKV